MTLHTDIDIGDTEVPALQIGSWFAPCSDAGVWWKILLRSWTPLDSVIGENTMASILCIPPRHVTTQTVAVFGRMKSGKTYRMAGKASRPVVLDGLEWLAVGIVAGAAPKPSAAVAGAGAQSKLLDVAYHFESASR